MVKTIKLTSHSSFKDISADTKEIAGIGHRDVDVRLRIYDFDKGINKVIKESVTDGKGSFALKGLNLEEYRVQELILEVYYNNNYFKEEWDLALVKFTVQ